MSCKTLHIDVCNGIATLSLDRPDKLNAIDNDLARGLLAAIKAAADNDDVRVLVLRGNGRAFCAGRDLRHAPTDEDLSLVQRVAKALVSLPKPVVAAVHGWAIGVGLEWMLNADLVVATQGSRFRLPEASLGVFVTAGLTATLPAFAGLARAKALMLLGEEFSAAQAHAWGMVWQVVPDAELEAATQRMATQLAKLQPQVASQFKRVLNEIGLLGFDRATELESAAQRALQARKA